MMMSYVLRNGLFAVPYVHLLFYHLAEAERNYCCLFGKSWVGEVDRATVCRAVSVSIREIAERDGRISETDFRLQKRCVAPDGWVQFGSVHCRCWRSADADCKLPAVDSVHLTLWS